MARSSRRARLFALLLLVSTATAQLSNLPDLETASDQLAQSQTAGDQTATQTNQQTETQQTQETATQQDDNDEATSITSVSSPTSAGGIGGITITDGGTLTNSAVHLTGLPTLAGVGIPELVIPWTGNAPYMRKSSMPEGTFFIAVGAVLAFMGACILLWRALVAWSVNRSVKRTAVATMGSRSEKTTSYGGWGGAGVGSKRKSTGGYNAVPKSGGVYKDDYGSSMSLDHLTSNGKPVGKPHFRDSTAERSTTAPSDLFFSPTAKPSNRDSGFSQNHRNSGYMPSGYYASPSSQAAGGQTNMSIGGTLAPNHRLSQRHSAISSEVSPPSSPVQHPQSRGSTLRPLSKDGLLNGRESSGGLRAPSRDGLGSNRRSYLYNQPSSSSLMVAGAGGSTSDLAGSRAPSAYLEDLFENHGNGPRERF